MASLHLRHRRNENGTEDRVSVLHLREGGGFFAVYHPKGSGCTRAVVDPKFWPAVAFVGGNDNAKPRTRGLEAGCNSWLGQDSAVWVPAISTHLCKLPIGDA